MEPYWNAEMMTPAAAIVYVYRTFFLAAMENRMAGAALSEKERRDPLFISCFYPDFDQLVCIHMGCKPWLFA